MNKQNKVTLTYAILIPIAIGLLSALLSGNMTLYDTIQKPALSPPAILFPIVWTVLYILMGISSYIILQSDDILKWNALFFYLLQLFVNFVWSIIFFGFGAYWFAFIWLLLLIGLILIMIYKFYQINPLAAYLQIPYLLWCIFASYLTYMIYILN